MGGGREMSRELSGGREIVEGGEEYTGGGESVGIPIVQI